MSEFHSSTMIEVRIDRLGGLGDGIGMLDDRTVFVPFACPGEMVRAEIVTAHRNEIRARLAEVLEAAPMRAEPFCSHFGSCGGCALQHLNAEAYAAFKQEQIARMLDRLGVGPSALQPFLLVGQGARRRVEFKVGVRKGIVQLGFHEARSHALVDVKECPVAHPDIMALLPELRSMLSQLKKPSNVSAVHITRLDKGCDILLSVTSKLNAADRQLLQAGAQRLSLLRLTEQCGEECAALYAPAPVTIGLGAVEVELPPGAFLQATQAAQDAITGFILAHIPAGRVIDLYAGCGTYSFPLQRSGCAVSAYEGSYDMVTAMHNAIRRAGLEPDMQAHLRDLFRDPIRVEAIRQVDAVVINPPRNGAEAQVKILASSGIKTIIMVSCNPATFERDARHLLAQGYGITKALPIDQFTWSPHLELVAVFRRE